MLKRRASESPLFQSTEVEISKRKSAAFIINSRCIRSDGARFRSLGGYVIRLDLISFRKFPASSMDSLPINGSRPLCNREKESKWTFIEIHSPPGLYSPTLRNTVWCRLVTSCRFNESKIMPEAFDGLDEAACMSANRSWRNS